MLLMWELLAGIMASFTALCIYSIFRGWDLLRTLVGGERKPDATMCIEYAQRLRSDLIFCVLCIPLSLFLHLIGYDPLRK